MSAARGEASGKSFEIALLVEREIDYRLGVALDSPGVQRRRDQFALSPPEIAIAGQQAMMLLVALPIMGLVIWLVVFVI